MKRTKANPCGTYVLDAKKQPVPISGLKWAFWFEKANRRVAETTIDEFWVSTVFLGLDHNFSDKGPPILFETMVFAEGGDSIGRGYFSKVVDYVSGRSPKLQGRLDNFWGWQMRYATWEQAERGHEKTVRMVRRMVAIHKLRRQRKGKEAVEEAEAMLREMDEAFAAPSKTSR